MANQINAAKREKLDGTGALELDASSFVYQADPLGTPFLTRLESMNRVRKVENRKAYQFNLVYELPRTYTVSGSTAGSNIITMTDTGGLLRNHVVWVPDGGCAADDVTELVPRTITAVVANTSITLNDWFDAADNDFANLDTIQRITSAAGAGSTSVTPVMPKPSNGTNNTQQVKKSIKIDLDQYVEKQYYNYNAIANKIVQNDYKLDLENAILFNDQMTGLTDASGNEVLMTRGFYRALVGDHIESLNDLGTAYTSLLNLANDGSTFTYETLMGFLQDAMTYGSRTKTLFADGWLMNRIAIIAKDTLRTKSIDTKLGIEIKTLLVAGKGEVEIMYSPNFDKGTVFKGGILIDMNFVNLNPFRAHTISLERAPNDADYDLAEFMGTYGIEYGAEENHGVITHL